MASVDQDQEPVFKHHCRVCKKGFMCGRALGGHMRAHGIGDESMILDDLGLHSDGDEKLGSTNRSMYRLRTNPNRFKSVRNCENCGEEFLSWKSFLEHGKCGSDEAESLVSSPNSEGDEDDDGGGERATSCGRWSKRKRSFRAKVDSYSTTYNDNSSTLEEEEEDLLLARCLIDLANTRVDSFMGVEQQEESSASASKEEERRNVMARLSPFSNRVLKDKAKCTTKGLFECKACKKVFNSHQALGGHRASHKKVKGCYAAKQDQNNNYSLADEDVLNQEEYFSSSKPPTSMQFEHIGPSKKKSKVHECSICHRLFSTGQALGGHKRCHWITSNAPDPSSLRKLQFPEPVEVRSNQDDIITKSEEAALDLNLPAQVVEDSAGIRLVEVSTEMHLLPLVEHADGKETFDVVCTPFQNQMDNKDVGNENSKNNNNNIYMNTIVEDEADSKSKLAKLSELKDMKVSCSSSQWLQVGIVSTTNVATNI
ncbi:hypothetical protein LIER_32042 [Lithospermum erythrorhizon]|uniref:C2H2-type domain-containing protein n=1 Tax=Lithospermum erythrorhizon TaxID=34254 RepID=A0AAV3RUY9_LITER